MPSPTVDLLGLPGSCPSPSHHSTHLNATEAVINPAFSQQAGHLHAQPNTKGTTSLSTGSLSHPLFSTPTMTLPSVRIPQDVVPWSPYLRVTWGACQSAGS